MPVVSVSKHISSCFFNSIINFLIAASPSTALYSCEVLLMFLSTTCILVSSSSLIASTSSFSSSGCSTILPKRSVCTPCGISFSTTDLDGVAIENSSPSNRFPSVLNSNSANTPANFSLSHSDNLKSSS